MSSDQKSSFQPLRKQTTSKLTWKNRLDHWLARCGLNRQGHTVEPGLYALGNPDRDSPVFVTAHYTLSFDALRSALAEVNAYILVLDTKGINVWCASGKGTFGTEELVHRLEATQLSQTVNHRVLILPQLGASGVCSYEVKRRTGFRVEFGPVRAADLPEYLKTRQATPEMRRVRFGLRDRLILIPVEIVHTFLYLLIALILAFFAGGLLSSLATLTAVWAGIILFPILLPWLPAKDFSRKGFILGGAAVLPFVLTAILRNPDEIWWSKAMIALDCFLLFPPVTAFLALNFTGSTTFTSRSGVRREIFTYVPLMAWLFGAGIILTLAIFLIRVLGGPS